MIFTVLRRAQKQRSDRLQLLPQCEGARALARQLLPMVCLTLAFPGQIQTSDQPDSRSSPRSVLMSPVHTPVHKNIPSNISSAIQIGAPI
jgi:hypothetical protein